MTYFITLCQWQLLQVNWAHYSRKGSRKKEWDEILPLIFYKVFKLGGVVLGFSPDTKKKGDRDSRGGNSRTLCRLL